MINTLYTNLEHKDLSVYMRDDLKEKVRNDLKFDYPTDSEHSVYDIRDKKFIAFENMCTNAPDINLYYTEDTYTEKNKYFIDDICYTIAQLETLTETDLEEGSDIFLVAESDDHLKEKRIAAKNQANGMTNRIFINADEYDNANHAEDYRVVIAHELVHSFQTQKFSLYRIGKKLEKSNGSFESEFYFKEGFAEYVARQLILYKDDPNSHASLSEVGLSKEQYGTTFIYKIWCGF